MVTAQCSKCWNIYCEACLYAVYDTLWGDIQDSRSGWECPKCTQNCHCKPCDKKAGIKHRVSSRRKRKRGSLFTRPGDDERNRGGVSDFIDKSFATDSMDSEDESSAKSDSSGDEDRIYSIRKDKNGVSSSKRKYEAGLSNRDPKRRRIPSKFNRDQDDTYSDSSSDNQIRSHSNNQSVTHVLGSKSNGVTKQKKLGTFQHNAGSAHETHARDIVNNVGTPKKIKIQRKRMREREDADEQGSSFNDLESRLLSREDFEHIMAFSPSKPLKRPRSQE
ncbi:hypothetical protein BGZ68_010390 [Mortierella alpina]|nr:hypothetical protein BGZ68_010390 [Mortierella alpina]